MFELEKKEREQSTVRELVRTIRLVPETKPVSDLMRQMQQENSHMVIVVDEMALAARHHGRPAGSHHRRNPRRTRT